MSMHEVEVVDPSPHIALNPQDLAELGAMMVTTGMTTIEARALIARIQQVSAQVALATAPAILDKIRDIQAWRLNEMYARIRLLPNYMGHVSRDAVLRIVADVAQQAPRQ